MHIARRRGPEGIGPKAHVNSLDDGVEAAVDQSRVPFRLWWKTTKNWPGGDLEKVRALLGHQGIDTTQTYATC